MNKGLLRGIGPEAVVPAWLGGGDPSNDGKLLQADSGQEGGGKLSGLSPIPDGSSPPAPLLASSPLALANRSVSVLGSRLVLFGHSLSTSGGTSAPQQGWHRKLAASLRCTLVDYAKGGAVLGWSESGAGATGDGGIFSILQLSQSVITAASPKPYVPMQQLTFFDFGNNDLGWGKQLQSFLEALRSGLSRGLSARQFEEGDPTIVWSAGWTKMGTPPTPTLVITGGVAGSYTYYIVGVNSAGDTVASTVVSTTVGPTTLDNTHTNKVQWTTMTGAVSYKVIRSAGGATQGQIGVTAKLLLTDNGLAAVAYTAPTASPVQVTASTLSASGSGYVGPAAAAETITMYVPADFEFGCDLAARIVVPGIWASGDPTFTLDGTSMPIGATTNNITLYGPTSISSTKSNVTSGGASGTATATLASVAGLSPGMTVVDNTGLQHVVAAGGISGNVVTVTANWGSLITYLTWNPLTTNARNNSIVYRFHGSGLAAGNGAQQTTLNGALTNGQTGVTALVVPALNVAVPSGTSVLLSYGGSRQLVTTNGVAAVGATSIPTTSFTSNAAYPIGANVIPVGHTIVMTVGSRPGGGDQGWYFDCWEIEAQPDPVILVAGLFKPLSYSIWTAPLPTDADVDTWNTAIKAMLGPGTEFPFAQFIDVDPFKKNAYYFSTDGVHPDDRGHDILPAWVRQQMETSPIITTLGRDAIAAQSREEYSVEHHFWQRITTGDITISNSNYVDLTSGGNTLEWLVEAMPGDTVMCGLNGLVTAVAVGIALDFVTIVNGQPNRYWSTDAIDAYANGIPGGSPPAIANTCPIFFLCPKMIHIDDFDNVGGIALLRIRLRGYTAGASRNLTAGTGASPALFVMIENRGQMSRLGASGGATAQD